MEYEINFTFDENCKKLKTVKFPTIEQAERAFEKYRKFAENHNLFFHANIKENFGA